MATIDMGRKVGTTVTLSMHARCIGELSLVVACAEAYLRTKWYPDPSDRLTNVTDRQDKQLLTVP